MPSKIVLVLNHAHEHEKCDYHVSWLVQEGDAEQNNLGMMKKRVV